MLRVALVIGVIEIALTTDSSHKPGMVFSVLIMVLVLGTYLWIIERVRKRRNWARAAILTFLALGIIASLVTRRRLPPIPFVLDLLSMLLDIVALVLLFAPPASRWFERARR